MDNRRSIHTQLVLLVLAVVVPVLGILLYSTITEVRHETARARAEAVRVAQLTAAHTEQLLLETKSFLAEIAQRPLVRSMDAERCDPFLKDFASLFPQFAGLGMIRASGEIICSASAPAGLELPNVADRAWFRNAVTTGTFTMSEVQIGRITGKWVAVLAQPVKDESGNLTGVLVIPLDLARVQTGLSRVELPPGSIISIVDGRGTIAARSLAPESWIGKSMRDAEIIDRVVGEKQGEARARGVDGTERLYGFTLIPGTDWHVYAGVPTEVAFAPARAVMIRQGLLLAVVTALIVTLLVYLKRQIAEPMKSLADAASAVAAGKLETRAPVAGPREVADVATQFNKMLEIREQYTKELERNARQLSALGEMGQAVSSTLDLNLLLRRVLEHLSPLLSAEALAILLREEGGFRHAATRGALLEPHRGRRLAADEGIAARVLATGEALWIRDTAESADGSSPSLGEGSVRSVQAVPLKLRGHVVGLMEAVHSRPDGLRPEDLKLLEAAASWTAIAIGNARQHEQLRRLAQQVISAHEEERERLSRELHDEAGQALTALKISLELMRTDLTSEIERFSPDRARRFRRRIDEAVELTDKTMGQLRLLSHALHPPLLEHCGLNSTLEALCKEFASHTRLAIDYRGRDIPSIPEPVALCFYRFLQESLTNVAKHAQASRVEVALHYESDTIDLRIADDGKGFDRQAVTNGSGRSGIGLIGMLERFGALGGELEIDSSPGNGTRLAARCKATLGSTAAV